MINNIKCSIIFMSLLVSTPSEAFAATSSDSSRNPFGGIMLIAWIIVYLSRRRAIGGWLLYFFIQLYASQIFSLILVPSTISNLNPSIWQNSILYVFFCLSTIPVLLVQAFETIAGTLLLTYRDEKNVRLLRKALVALALTSGASLGIDIAYFQEGASIFFDVLTLLFSIIWFFYFTKSQRVRLVFFEKNWTYIPPPIKPPLTPQEKSYLWKRAAVLGAIIFVAFFIFMGYEKATKNQMRKSSIYRYSMPWLRRWSEGLHRFERRREKLL